MAESKRETPQIAKEAGKPGDNSRGDGGRVRSPEADAQAAQQAAERLAALGEEGMRRVADAPIAATGSALRSGSAVADSAQEIANAWARYAEDVVRHTSEASRALLRARTFGEMLEVQATLLRDNMQAFLDQSAKVAASAGKLATRPFEVLTEATTKQTPR